MKTLSLTGNWSNSGDIHTYPSNSSYNSYIPISSLSKGEVLTFSSKRKTFIYDLVSPAGRTAGVSRMNRFCNAMLDRLEWLRLDHLNIARRYVSRLGMLMWAEESPVYSSIPLMLIGVKRDELFNIKDPSKVRYDQLCLVIDFNFVNDEEHFKLYRNVKKYYIDGISEDMDVIYTHDLMSTCFNPGPVQIPKFKTLKEKLEYMNSLSEQSIRFLTAK